MLARSSSSNTFSAARSPRVPHTLRPSMPLREGRRQVQRREEEEECEEDESLAVVEMGVAVPVVQHIGSAGLICAGRRGRRKRITGCLCVCVSERGAW